MTLILSQLSAILTTSVPLFPLNNKHKVHDKVHPWGAQAAFPHDLFSTHYRKTSAGAFFLHIVSFLPPSAHYLVKPSQVSGQDLFLLPLSPSPHLHALPLMCYLSDQTAVCLRHPTAEVFSHPGQLELSSIKSRQGKWMCVFPVPALRGISLAFHEVMR